MSKLRITYIASLVILVVLIGFVVFQPIAAGDKYSEVQKEQLLQTESEWIIQFDIINHEVRDQNYIINIAVGEKLYTDSVSIKDGAKFSYIYHFHPDLETDEYVSLNIYKEGETTPFEQTVYHLK
jgi:uncharacterized membrane protein